MARKAKHSARRLDEPAGEVIRHRAEKLLKDADAAVERLRDADDAAALHDARVALRRVRSWFQAFREELPLKRTQKHDLRRLAHSTNTARDAEVALKWLSARKVVGKTAAGKGQFASELQDLRERSYRKVRRDLPPSWRKLARKLASIAEDVEGPKRPFRKPLKAALKRYGKQFERARSYARRDPVPPRIHALRIAGKKLRYLADNALGNVPQARGFLREMNTLHDAAGTIQDLQRLLALSEEGFLKRADRRYRHLFLSGNSKVPGFTPDMAPYVEVSRVAARERAQRIARFRSTYLSRKSPACLLELQGLIGSLGS